MDRLKRRPVDYNEALDRVDDRGAEESGATDAGWEPILREVEGELKQARVLLEKLETLTASLREQLLSDEPIGQ